MSERTKGLAGDEAGPDWLTRIAPDRDRPLPLGRQLYLGLYEAITRGEVPRGQALPASRRLATRFGLARDTVVAAYGQLADEGLVESAGRRGTVVVHEAPVERPTPSEVRLHWPLAARAEAFRSVPAGRRALSPGEPDPGLFPAARVAWLVLPPGQAPRARQVLRALGGGHGTLVQACVAELLEAGIVSRHLQRARAVYAQRRAVLLECVAASPVLELVGGAVCARCCRSADRCRAPPSRRASSTPPSGRFRSSVLTGRTSTSDPASGSVIAVASGHASGWSSDSGTWSRSTCPARSSDWSVPSSRRARPARASSRSCRVVARRSRVRSTRRFARRRVRRPRRAAVDQTPDGRVVADDEGGLVARDGVDRVAHLGEPAR